MGKQSTLPVRPKQNVIPITMDAAFFYERALKSLDKYDFKKAVRYFKKAMELEPDNALHYCNLAGTLSELGNYEESNQYLQQVLNEIDQQMVVCHFYMANNFVNMGDIRQAEQSVLTYMEKDPDGEFIEEAEELLDFISMELGRAPMREETEEETAEQLHDRAKDLIEEGSFLQAQKVLQQVLQEEPDYVAAKNNLALCYYYSGQMEKGLAVIEEVLREDPTNIHALCNLAIFYSHEGLNHDTQELLDSLNKVIPMQFDEIYKLATTLGILEQHEAAYSLFRKLSKYTFYFDTAVLHYTAVAAFNLQKWKEARKWWKKSKLTDDEPELWDKLIELSHLVEQGRMPFQPLSYHFPSNESDDVLQTGKGEAFYEAVRKNPMIRSSFLWALRFGDTETKLQVLQAIRFLEDSEGEEVLRYFLMMPEEEENLKRIAVLLLHDMGAEEPYKAEINGQIEYLYAPTHEEAVFMTRWRMVMECFEYYMGEQYSYEEHQQAHHIWIEFLRKVYPDVPQIRKKETWAAAVEYFVARHQHKKVTQTEIAERYGISPSSLAKNYRKLYEYLRGS